jgi:phosphate transport system protein
MGRYYDENYDLLKQKLHSMVDQVQTMIEQTLAALTSEDVEAARSIIAKDEEIDHLEVEIDELIIKLLALQQPMAVDLRFLIAALKINNDLERMGDQAVNIAQAVLIVHQDTPAPKIVDFTRMEEVVQEMVRGCVDAFNSGNAELASTICRRDDEVDNMNRDIIRSLGRHSRQHPEHAELCLSLLLVSRNLERIADLCTNIAEEVVYYVHGRIIKHSSSKSDE